MPTTRHLLSAASLAALSLATEPCLAQASLTAWWAFDGDYTSQVNNAVFSGTAVGAGTSITNTAGQFVNGTGGLAIDDSLATANFVSVGTSPIIDTNASITVSGWYQLNDLAGDGMDTRNFVWETAPSNYTLSYALRSDTDDGQKRGQWYTQSPAFSGNADTGPVINQGTWYHAAVVINQSNSSLQYYHNGVLTDDVSLPGGYAVPSGIDGFNIGNHRAGDGSRNWDGYIDDVAVFQGALTGSDVASLYNGSDTPLSLVNWAITAPPLPDPDPLAFVPGSWTMVVIPDTQNYSTNHPEIFSEVTQWIADNDDRNIALTLHVGDITNRNNTTEWDRAYDAISRLDGEVPYILATGNHDYGPGGGAGDRSTLFNDYFDEGIYYETSGAGSLVYDNIEIAEQFVDTARFGAGPDNETLENVAYDFTAPDGREMLIFSLEWGVRQEVVDWANAVAAREEYEGHTAILLTHAYMYSDDERYDWTNQNTANDEPGNTHSGSSQGANPHVYNTADTDDGNPANDTNDGEELWRELVSQHGNFEMTFNGHVIIGGQLGYRQDAGSIGQQVHQMLYNAQADANGGDGWIRLLEFLPDGETVQVKTYSPYRDRLGLDPWRTDADNQFTISLTGIDSLVGDLDGDGFVGVGDLDVLLANWGESTAFFDVTLGDVSGDGVVGQADLDLVLLNWGHGTPPSGNVPEPGTLASLAFLLAGLHRRRRCR
ncbi:PEP-CTERM sorting domain-containing protein [Phycisphaeraceae bacterium D3-23]